VDKSVSEYLLRVVEATRSEPQLRLGASPRGSLTLYRCAQARALIDGRDFVLPDDVRALAIPVLAHRVSLDTKARYGGVLTEQVVQQIVDKTPVPR
jgi:MoxR-like ATPase